MSRLFHLTFNEDFYEIRISRGILSITKYYGYSQIPKEVKFNELPPQVQQSIVDEINNEGEVDNE